MSRTRVALGILVAATVGAVAALGVRPDPATAARTRAFWRLVGGPLPAASERDLDPVPYLDLPADRGPLPAGSVFAPPRGPGVPGVPGDRTDAGEAR